jgi:hypothetical protein
MVLNDINTVLSQVLYDEPPLIDQAPRPKTEQLESVISDLETAKSYFNHLAKLREELNQFKTSTMYKIEMLESQIREAETQTEDFSKWVDDMLPWIKDLCDDIGQHVYSSGSDEE